MNSNNDPVRVGIGYILQALAIGLLMFIFVWGLNGFPAFWLGCK